MAISNIFAPRATSGHRTGLIVLAWSGFESICRQILSLLFFLITVRFIGPADLGAFSLGVAIVGIAAVVVDEPIGEALVQKATATKADWDTGYTLNLATALACLLLACLASPLLAYLLHEPSLKLIIPALAASSAVGAVGNIHKAYLSRSFKFRTIAQTALVAQLVAGGATLALAANGFGYWALVCNVVAAAALTSLIYRIFTPWRPRLTINPEFLQQRWRYLTSFIAIRVLYLLRDQSLLVVAGLIADITTVGLLSLAMRVTRALGQVFEEITARPLISLISREQHDLSRFGDVLKSVLQIVGLFAFPGFIGLAETGAPLISLLLGSQWTAAAGYLPWLCAGSAGWLFLHIVAVALRARGSSRAALRLTAPTIFIDVAIFASAAFIGIDWALKLWAVRAVLTIPVLVSVLSNHLGVSALSLAQAWAPPAVAATLMLLALRVLETNAMPHSKALALLTLIGAGAAVYGVAMLAMSMRSSHLRLNAGINPDG